MHDINDITNRYLALWNEPDAAKRRAAIEALWVPHGEHVSKRLEARGYDELEARIASTYEQWVATEGFVFGRHDEPQMHHDAIRFRWNMARRDNGGIDAVGVDFFRLAPDGRVLSVYQFVED